MSTILCIDVDSGSRDKFVSDLRMQGIGVSSTGLSDVSLIFLTSGMNEDGKAEEVKEIRNQFPNSPLVVMTRFLTIALIYRIASSVDGVFSIEGIKKNNAGWENFIQGLRSIERL